MSRSPTPPPKRSAAKERWLAKVPLDEEDFIHSIARTVKDHGKKYEENLKAKQRSNPEYTFMFDDNVSVMTSIKNRNSRIDTGISRIQASTEQASSGTYPSP
jgi:U2-associated protein SR140